MFKDWLKHYRARDHFDPSGQEFVGPDDLVKILEGKVTLGDPSDSVYFIVSHDGLRKEGTIRVDDVIDDIFEKSVWFGKFVVQGQSQLIVPGRYDVMIHPKKKQLYLQATRRAGYYGGGNLQLDKDGASRILRTDIDFDGLRKLVNSSCSGYRNGKSLQAWNDYGLQ